MEVTKIIYFTTEFLVFSLISLLIFIFLIGKVKIRLKKIENTYNDKRKTLENLKRKLHYKQDLLLEKKKELLRQEDRLNHQEDEFKKRYVQAEKELEKQLQFELDNFQKTCFREIDILWKDKIKKLIYNAILGKK